MSDKMETSEFFLSVGNGKKVRTIFKIINLKDLSFYPENPRISSVLIGIEKKLSNDEIEKLMLEKQRDTVNILYQQVKKDGQINEPLTVYQGKVLEGNTRLCVVRRLFADTKDEKWTRIPCRVITEKLEKVQIDYIICNYHIKHKKDWVPFEEACYFYKMKYEDKLTYEDISRLTDVNIIKVMDEIKTFQLMLKDKKAQPNEWSLYYETYKLPESKRAMQNEFPNLVSDVAKKYRKGEIYEAQDARKLKIILKDKKTAKEFFSSPMDIKTAETKASHRLPSESDRFLKDLNILTDSINDLPVTKVDEIRKDKRKVKLVKDLVISLKKLCKQLKIRI